MPNDNTDAAKVMREAIAARVRGALAECHKTQRDIAPILGIPQSSVSLSVRGKRPFRAEELATLADHLGVPVERFMPVSSQASAA